ncbi:hypothetical protein [Pararhizobium sp. A13]
MELHILDGSISSVRQPIRAGTDVKVLGFHKASADTADKFALHDKDAR